ncbi:MAG TPA: hypothetical protein VFX92_07120 [Candidatus Krumholzibacteria bacterium]|nr:hypothetical protein [Candidatus Krumholzibacteria bacterium]
MKNSNECFDVVRQNKVRLRGWDFPHVSSNALERDYSNDYFASWSNFATQEYWRFYKSGQFIFLATVRETYDAMWKNKLLGVARQRIFMNKPDGLNWDKVPGFISIVNTAYMFTEIFEFFARLCAAGVYSGDVQISIMASGIDGFVLAADESRAWNEYFSFSGAVPFKYEQSVSSDALYSDVVTNALQAVEEFFMRFGLTNAPRDILRDEISGLLERKG